MDKLHLEFIRKIDEGSFSKVYLVNKENNLFACKIIDYGKAQLDYISKFVERELLILKRIKHRNIIDIDNIYKVGKKCYILMRYAERGNLFDHISNHGALTENQGKVWAKQLIQAVKYLHGLNIAHRDLKCENVLITAKYNIKLTDFGFSRWIVDENSTTVFSNTFCGTLLYAAPEIIKRKAYLPKSADMWSLGIVLYIMLNMAMPFVEQNVQFLYHLQMNQAWEFNPVVRNSLSVEYKMLVMNLLQPDINKRWNIDDVYLSKWLRTHSRSSMKNLFIYDEEVKLDNLWNNPMSGPSMDTKSSDEGVSSMDLTFLMKPK